MTDQERELDQKVREVYEHLKEAKNLADKYGLSFYFAVMEGRGATYYGDKNESWYETDSGWVSSSMGC